MLRAVEHVLAFARSDVVFREKCLAGGLSFDFHEDRHIALLRDDINFPIRSAEIARGDLISAPGEPICCHFLAPCADFLFVFGHGGIVTCNFQLVTFLPNDDKICSSRGETMVAKLILRDKEYEVKPGMSLLDALKKINIVPESVIATRDGEMITDDEILRSGDVIKLIAVISGGGV